MRKALPLIGAVLVRTLHATLRVRHVRSAAIEEMSANGKQYIVTFWHQHLLLMLHSRFRRPIAVMSSQSKDGDISAGVFGFYGIEVVRGSSTRGGSLAMRGFLRAARAGRNLAFTPDGPKGPARVLKDGVIYAAQATGLPIIPVAFAAHRKKLLRSWDRMIVPVPFTRALFLYGEPVHIPRDSDVESWRLTVEEQMNAQAEEAETQFESLWQEGSTKK